MGMKTCNTCFQSLPLEMFRKRTASKDGLAYDCRSCHNISTQKWRDADPSRVQSVEKRRYLKRKDQVSMNQSLSIVSRPELHRAHVQVKYALDTGKLERPSSCSRCGRTAKVIAHHHDYSQPLDVEWICRSCHTKEHRTYISPTHTSGQPQTGS